ncbi:MAG: nuclear transport factor 2 family protein [Calditrichia bacterium]
MRNRYATLFLLILSYLISAPLFAGGEHEIEKVEELINTFNQNIIVQNVEEIGERLHPRFQAGISSKNEMGLYSRSAFLESFKMKNMGGVPTEVKIKNMDISGSVGTVTALLVSKSERIRAYYNLLRTDSGWIIFNLVMEKKPNPAIQN